MTSARDTSTGKRIRKQRESLGLSIEGLSYKAGVSYKTIERIEAGTSEPRRATLAMIEQALAAVAAETRDAA